MNHGRFPFKTDPSSQRKVTITFAVPVVEGDLSEAEIITLFRDALYEFVNRGSERMPPRRSAEDYVNSSYKNFDGEWRASKLAEVKRRVNFATKTSQTILYVSSKVEPIPGDDP